MIYLKRIVFTIICIIVVIALGIFVGIYLYNMNNTANENFNNSITEVNLNENYIEEQNAIEISNREEKTTPNTLLIYRTYYTKCNHYINEYKDIDINAVNLNKNELQDINEGWRIEDFSSEQVIFSKEVEDFCMEHFKLKMVDGIVKIYILDEEGNETEYENTDITEEYLTNEDILKLKEGILVYGKESLTSTIEDYE